MKKKNLLYNIPVFFIHICKLKHLYIVYTIVAFKLQNNPISSL